ncbi:MAG: hypothetical protein WC156_07460 [Pedobacter sp.]
MNKLLLFLFCLTSTITMIKGISGDGLARLNRQTAGYRKDPDTTGLRYRILLGDTSEKPLKTIEVGTDNSYTLWDLKNHQTYFIQSVFRVNSPPLGAF